MQSFGGDGGNTSSQPSMLNFIQKREIKVESRGSNKINNAHMTLGSPYQQPSSGACQQCGTDKNTNPLNTTNSSKHSSQLSSGSQGS